MKKKNKTIFVYCLYIWKHAAEWESHFEIISIEWDQTNVINVDFLIYSSCKEKALGKFGNIFIVTPQSSENAHAFGCIYISLYCTTIRKGHCWSTWINRKPRKMLIKPQFSVHFFSITKLFVGQETCAPRKKQRIGKKNGFIFLIFPSCICCWCLKLDWCCSNNGESESKRTKITFSFAFSFNWYKRNQFHSASSSNFEMNNRRRRRWKK